MKIAKTSIRAFETITEVLVKKYEQIFEIVQETKLVQNGKAILFKLRDGTEAIMEAAQIKATLVAKGMRDKADQILGFCIRGCFTAETLILTKNGLKRIDLIQEGEYVLAKDVNTGTTGFKKVIYVYKKHSNELIKLNIEGEEIRTTASHLFFTEEGWWRAGENIKPGDRILTSDGELKTVKAVSVEMLPEPEKIYNLNV